nr:hypothetical protein [Tanacetum cinerariifolium]
MYLRKCGSGLGKGLCYICGHNPNSLNDSPSISETSSQSPPNINHCCYECGDPLDDIFCKQCTCMSCGKDANIGYNCPSKVSVISNPKPCNNQTINELPQTLPIFHPTFQSEAESQFTLDSTPTYVDESPNIFNHFHNLLFILVNFAGTMLIMVTIVHLKLRLSIRSRVTIKTLISHKIIKKKSKLKKSERKLPVCYDDDDDEEISDSLDDNIISGLLPFSAITPDEPVLSTEEPDNSLSMGDEHLDTISATKLEEFIKSGIENLIPIPSESEGIPEHMSDSYEFTDELNPFISTPEYDCFLFKV